MLKEANSFSIAKRLVEISLNEEGRVDPEKINLILAELRNKPMSHSLPVLRNFLSLIKTKINSYEGYLEKADPSSDSSSNLISENISQAHGKRIDFVIEENNSLIAGFRLRIGDDVYEDSIASRIARLKKSLT
jgi:F-type H+-transporting ATPase subunit delta|tara:strand:- start:115 stop:513 length:399 start_codon:yes stop_codon:yes gene_type:complete